MGSPVSLVVADIFMHHLEEKALANVKLKLWKRFVDDVIAVVKKNYSQTLLAHLNNQHERIEFTMEEEQNGSLPFMDIRFTRNEGGNLEREVCQKLTHTNRYLQYTSYHPQDTENKESDEAKRVSKKSW